MTTRAGRPTDEAEQQIAAQERSTCGVCGGARRLTGRRIDVIDNTPLGPVYCTIECSKCAGEDPVPADPDGQTDLEEWRADLEGWAKKADDLLSNFRAVAGDAYLSMGKEDWQEFVAACDSVDDLRHHLAFAAMPRPAVAAAGALAQWREAATKLLDDFTMHKPYSLSALRTHLAAMPAQDSLPVRVNATEEPVWAELLKALKGVEYHLVQMREYIACERCQHTNPTDRAYLLAARQIARAAIAQAEKGAAG